MDKLKMLITFEGYDLEKMDRMRSRYGLPNRASAVRLGFRNFEEGVVMAGPTDPLKIAESAIGGPEQDEDSLLEPGWRYLDDLAKETGGRFVDMRKEAIRRRATKVLPNERIIVSPAFVEFVMEEKERRHE